MAYLSLKALWIAKRTALLQTMPCVRLPDGQTQFDADLPPSPVQSADKILRGLGLKPEYIKISGGTIKTAKVDCQKGAPLTLRGPDGKGSIVVDGPSSVYRHAGQCYSIIQGCESVRARGAQSSELS